MLIFTWFSWGGKCSGGELPPFFPRCTRLSIGYPKLNSGDTPPSVHSSCQSGRPETSFKSLRIFFSLVNNPKKVLNGKNFMYDERFDLFCRLCIFFELYYPTVPPFEPLYCNSFLSHLSHPIVPPFLSSPPYFLMPHYFLIKLCAPFFSASL